MKILVVTLVAQDQVDLDPLDLLVHLDLAVVVPVKLLAVDHPDAVVLDKLPAADHLDLDAVDLVKPHVVVHPVDQVVVLLLVLLQELLLPPFLQPFQPVMPMVVDANVNLKTTNALLDLLDLRVFPAVLDLMVIPVLMVLLVLMLKTSPPLIHLPPHASTVPLDLKVLLVPSVVPDPVVFPVLVDKMVMKADLVTQELPENKDLPVLLVPSVFPDLLVLKEMVNLIRFETLQ